MIHIRLRIKQTTNRANIDISISNVLKRSIITFKLQVKVNRGVKI